MSDIKQGHARIVAARELLLEVRGERIEQLLRLRTYLRTLLAEFVTGVDPVTGSRLVEISAEGSKTSGDLAMSLALFEGTKLRFAVDGLGRFSATTVPADLMLKIGRIVDLRVSADATRAEFDYEPVNDPTVRKTGDVAKLVALIVETAAVSVEGDIIDVPQREIAFAPRPGDGSRAVAAPAT